jgi:hypothetical protein
VDRGRQVVAEWERAVEWEWFQNWYMGFVQNFRVVDLATKTCNDVLKKLRTDFGFPGSGDVWLVRTALADRDDGSRGESIILSEDMDLYDPPHKGDPVIRERCLQGTQEGALARHLRKAHDVKVRSVVRLLPD